MEEEIEILRDWQAVAFERGMTEHTFHFLSAEDALLGRKQPLHYAEGALVFIKARLQDSPKKSRIVEALERTIGEIKEKAPAVTGARR